MITRKRIINYQEYNNFLEKKRHSINNYGIDSYFIPETMFDFQKYVTEYLIKKGRAACFLDTGLGKTIIELTVAANYVKHTNKRVLIMTPLAVAHQHIKEANKFEIDDVSYSKEGKLKSKIVLCNYERLDKFNPNDFDCVISDESSILKNFNGIIKSQITSFLKKVKYRYLFTATPSPNDFIELGTSSEALGYMGYTDMLTKFFTNNEDTISPINIGTKWILKGHAKEDFFKWVSSWSISMRKPSDLGFDDDGFVLPELITNQYEIKNEINTDSKGRFCFFPNQSTRMTELRAEQRQSLIKRCEKAVELTNKHKTSVYWCNLNDEADLLQELDKSAYQISGNMNLDRKEELLVAFFDQEISKLITKPKMTAFGLNWQHCTHTTYFPTFSYEQYYQAIRRFWRFGQAKEVIADLIYSEGQKKMLNSLFSKSKKANELFSKLNANINSNFEIKENEFKNQLTLPIFI